MKTTTPYASVESLRRWLLESFNRDRRRRGMTPIDGALYQPIPFSGFEDLPVERDSTEARYELIDEYLRPAKSILDLGCANGYFVLRAASQPGSTVHGLGVDYQEDNVLLAESLSQIFGLSDRARFEQCALTVGTVRDLVATRPWDIILLLNVHHHLLREIGLDETCHILRQLYLSGATVILEQGSLSQQEYEAWTGRREPFDTGSFSRLTSMLERSEIPLSECVPLGFGRYLSGLRKDDEGSRRAMLACGAKLAGRGIRHILRKAHKNGVYMEILLGPRHGMDMSWVWKNCVTGPSLAERETQALTSLASERGFPRLIDAATATNDARYGLVRMRDLWLRPVGTSELASQGESLRNQLVERLLSLARRRILHTEIHPSHLQLSRDDELVLFDFETACFGDEDRDPWLHEVVESNPALGLGVYPRELLFGDRWREVDLLAADRVLAEWGLAQLTEEELRSYRSAWSEWRE